MQKLHIATVSKIATVAMVIAIIATTTICTFVSVLLNFKNEFHFCLNFI